MGVQFADLRVMLTVDAGNQTASQDFYAYFKFEDIRWAIWTEQSPGNTGQRERAGWRPTLSSHGVSTSALGMLLESSISPISSPIPLLCLSMILRWRRCCCEILVLRPVRCFAEVPRERQHTT